MTTAELQPKLTPEQREKVIAAIGRIRNNEINYGSPETVKQFEETLSFAGNVEPTRVAAKLRELAYDLENGKIQPDQISIHLRSFSK